MARKIFTMALLAVCFSSGSASAKVYPVGLTLKDAGAAAVKFAATQPVPGTPTTPATVSCKTVSWMAARCVWVETITPSVASGANSCTGTVSVVRQQVKGFPLKLTRVAGTKIVCHKVTIPS